MRITDINIDRFGVWRDLSLPLNERGVTVFYGPNEAGKSTLMRFVRGTLYGFNPEGQRITRHGLSTDGKGSLRITHDGGEYTVSREAAAGQRGRMRVDDLDWGTISDERMTSFLGGISEAMFENIFAIGLFELQELATLDGAEVAQHIYGLSLGPDGERILRAHDAFEAERVSLVSDDHRSGELIELAQRLAEIDRQLAEIVDVSQKHQHLRTERDRLSAEIEQAEMRRRNREDNLRGHRHLERVHGPWSRERKLRQEQSALPLLGSIPEDAIKQYDALERQIGDHKRQRSTLLDEAKRLYREAGKHTGDTTLLQHECTIRRLADEREEMRQRQRRLEEKQSRAEKVKRQLESRLSGMSGGWSPERITHDSTPAAGLGRLLAAAQAYQKAQRKKARTVSHYKQFMAAAQKRQGAFNDRMKSLGGGTLESAVKSTRRQLADIEELNSLRLDEARLTGELSAPKRKQASAMPKDGILNFRDLPPLFYLVMWFFTGAGMTLFICGLLWASRYENVLGNTAWIVGAIYSCFGLCMAGVTWTVRQHFEQFFDGELYGDARYRFIGKAESRQPEVDPEAEQKLARIKRTIADLVQRSTLPGLKEAIAEGAELAGSDVLLSASQRLAELEALKQDEERIGSDRKRLSEFRETLRERQRDVGLKRREWCDVLRELGLDETLNVDKAVAQWQALMEASDLRREHASLAELIERDEQAIESHQQDMDRIVGLLPTTNMIAFQSDPDRLLAHWLEELKTAGGLTEEQSRLRREGRAKRKDASRLERTIRKLRSEQRMLLMQAGASTRDELEGRMQALMRQREITRLLEDLQLEVQIAAEEEPQLALVEEDLLAFNAGENKRRIIDTEIEVKQIDHDIQTAREELGRVKRELAELANDRRSVTLRVEREQIADELRQATEHWCALDLATDSINRIRHRIERHCQSETLQQASKYLSQLTTGRYHNIWSPLGERHLCVDDDADQTLTAAQLSTGTREQLFLAIRLAMIRRFAQQGIELPLVLDDVFVNFDQSRTEAAVETILEVAEAGQQVLLFTCHLHLADIFEEKGVDAVWLPSNTVKLEERRAG